MESSGHAGDSSSDSRSGGYRGHPETSGQTGVGLGGMGCSLLVTDIDDPDALLDTSIEYRDDVPAGEGEHHVDVLVAQGSSDDLAAMDLGHGPGAYSRIASKPRWTPPSRAWTLRAARSAPAANES